MKRFAKNFKRFTAAGCLCLIACLGASSFALAQNVESFKGEEITYTIRKFGLNSGKATLRFYGHQKFEGKDVHLIVFTADAPNFYDQEKIYVDPQTFYPIAVQRDLNIFGKKEKITEYYLADKGVVEVVKLARGEKTRQSIKKDTRIDNIYCFIYRFRMVPTPSMEKSFLMHLPTKDVQMQLVKKMPLATGGRRYNSIFLESNPKQYRVWFDDSKKKIPLRIDGSAGLMSTSMVMQDYQK